MNGKQTALLRALAKLVDAAEDTVNQFEATHFPVGADLADSIRVFLKPALAKYRKLKSSAPSVAAAEKKKSSRPRRAIKAGR